MFVYVLRNVGEGVGNNMPQFTCEGHKTTHMNPFSPSTVWRPSIKLR